MKKLVTALLIGALMAAGSAAQAATTITTPGFTLVGKDTHFGPFEMELLSNENGTARIGLDTGVLSSYSVDTTRPEHGLSDGDFSLQRLAGSVHQGYRITSMTLSAVVNGALYVESQPCTGCSIMWDGYARNEARFDWSLTQGTHSVALPGGTLQDITTRQAVELIATQPVSDEFLLDLQTSALVSARGTTYEGWDDQWHWERHLNANASISLTDYVLTVQVVPVPEPSTYAMLLAGLGIAGWAARRKKTA